ncbi:macro domain-containing protein RSc0334-like [Anticarsia gemmatalis]|uniref:macro domain-containing protein RSc0334-like n=1 Tax=Anticarsia gemmatalis TaxID=129554 RepID=UPI003F75CC1E
MFEQNWKSVKAKLLDQTLEQRRKNYKSKDYIAMEVIDPWCDYVVRNRMIVTKKHTIDDLTKFLKVNINPALNEDLAKKVSIVHSSITKLEVDAIVNPANVRLKAWGSTVFTVDGAIHREAGPLLQAEVQTFGGCLTGDARASCGYNLPARYVIHTVGPTDKSAAKLESCYEKCLTTTKLHNIRTIAFPCIATGVYGFPRRAAAHIALQTARKFLEVNQHLDRVIFCTFTPTDKHIYETLLQLYFPVHEWNF